MHVDTAACIVGLTYKGTSLDNRGLRVCKGNNLSSNKFRGFRTPLGLYTFPSAGALLRRAICLYVVLLRGDEVQDRGKAFRQMFLSWECDTSPTYTSGNLRTSVASVVCMNFKPHELSQSLAEDVLV